MNALAAPTLSIVIPQYRTEQLIRLCLRALRKYSSLPMEVIVVDNNSGDASLDYLRTVPWIKLIENTRAASLGTQAHKEALDLGVRAARGDWIMLLHSDTIFLKTGWDRDMIAEAEQRQVVGFSSVIRDINRFETPWQRLKRRVRERKLPAEINQCGEQTKVMSYCFGIQRTVLESLGFSFAERDGDVVSVLFHTLRLANQPFWLMGRRFQESRLWHTSNATSILTAQITDSDLVRKYDQKSARLFNAPEIQSLLADHALDGQTPQP